MIYLILTAFIFLTDFFVKKYIDKKYARKVTHPRCGGKIILEKYYNNGAALGLLHRSPALLRAIQTVIIVIAGTIFYLFMKVPGKQLSKTGLALLMGGGANNLYDRYTKGHVVDYFHLNFGPKRLRRIIFNLSDFAIFIGALLTALGAEE